MKLIGDLDGFRELQEMTMTATGTLVRDTLTSDGMGGFLAGSIGGSIMCRVGTTVWTATEREIAGRLGIDNPYMVTLPAGTEVNERDRIEEGGKTLEVVAVLKPTLETARRCICEEI